MPIGILILPHFYHYHNSYNNIGKTEMLMYLRTVGNFTCTHIDTFTWCSCIILCLRIQRARGQSSENVSICFCLNNAACSLCYRRLIKTHRRGTLSSKALSSFCIYILVEVLCSNLRKRRPRKSIVDKKENTFFRAMRMESNGDRRRVALCRSM